MRKGRLSVSEFEATAKDEASDVRVLNQELLPIFGVGSDWAEHGAEASAIYFSTCLSNEGMQSSPWRVAPAGTTPGLLKAILLLIIESLATLKCGFRSDIEIESEDVV